MSDAHFSPKDYINYHATTKGITVAEIGVAPLVVLSWWEGVVNSLAKSCGAEPQENWVSGGKSLYTGEINGLPVSFARLPIGAPATVTIMEELIACGAQTFVAIGWAGSLQPDLPIGSMFIPTSCVVEEGTSGHYPIPCGTGVADKTIRKLIGRAAEAAGVQVIEGKHWTTDAPYRELTSKVERFREQGVLGVDMETSAMYTLAKYRNVRICSLLVVSDELWHEWKPAFHSPDLDEGNRLAKQIILESVRNIEI